MTTTTYGTIPTSTHPHAPAETDLISRATTHLHNHLSTLRPWTDLISKPTFSNPRAPTTILSRATTNIPYFLPNYTLITLTTLLLSLITHPLALLIFVSIIVSWIVLYFIRDAPLVILGRVVDDVFLLGGLCVASLLFLLVSGVEGNIVGGVCVGLAICFIHSVILEVDDVAVLDDGFGNARLVSS